MNIDAVLEINDIQLFENKGLIVCHTKLVGYSCCWIPTDKNKARRIKIAISAKIIGVKRDSTIFILNFLAIRCITLYLVT